MVIQFKKQTLEILQGLSQLNPDIVFRQNSPLTTISTDQRVIAKATIPETIPSDAAVSNITSFVNQANLFDVATVVFNDPQFVFTEGNTSALSKQSRYPYGSIDQILYPESVPSDITDNDVEFVVPYADISRLLQAIESDRAKQYEAYANDQNGANQLPEISIDTLSNLNELQRISQQFAESLTASGDPTDGQESGYGIEIYGQAPNTIIIYITKDSVRQDNLLILLPDLTTPDFFDDFSFYLSPNDFNLISGIDYTFVLSSDRDVIQLNGQYPYVETTDNTAAYNAAQVQYQIQVSAYEAAIANGENPTPPTAPNVDAYLTETIFTSNIKYWIPAIYQPR